MGGEDVLLGAAGQQVNLRGPYSQVPARYGDAVETAQADRQVHGRARPPDLEGGTRLQAFLILILSLGGLTLTLSATRTHLQLTLPLTPTQTPTLSQLHYS